MTSPPPPKEHETLSISTGPQDEKSHASFVGIGWVEESDGGIASRSDVGGRTVPKAEDRPCLFEHVVGDISHWYVSGRPAGWV